MLDIEVAGAIAPGVSIVVYFAPNTDQGFYEAISQAAHDTTYKPDVMSISWGGPEDSWSSSSVDAMQSALEDAVALGVSVTVAAGDGGSSDGESDGAAACRLSRLEPVRARLRWHLARCERQRHLERGRVERHRDRRGRHRRRR